MLMSQAQKLDHYEFLPGSRNIGWPQWAGHQKVYLDTR